jgi:hypothetical protein
MLILKLMIYSYMESWKLPILTSISKQTDIQFLADIISFIYFFLLVVKNTTTEFHKSSVVLLMLPLTIAINSRNTRIGSNISAYIYIIIYVHVKK